MLSDDDARHAAPDLDSSDVPSPSRTAALADVDLYGRLNAHWDFKWTSERLAQLERDEALARKLQEQVRSLARSLLLLLLLLLLLPVTTHIRSAGRLSFVSVGAGPIYFTRPAVFATIAWPCSR